MPHLSPTAAAAQALARRIGLGSGPVHMLNLLRFRDRADYSAAPLLAPSVAISGARAYERYAEGILPLLRASGGDVVFEADAQDWFIGPDREQWHRVVIVRQANLRAFFAFASDPAAVAVLGHRTAALADSRLLPMSQAAADSRERLSGF